MNENTVSKEERRENQIVSGNILAQLLLFFFPILLGTFFQQLYNTADAMVRKPWPRSEEAPVH